MAGQPQVRRAVVAGADVTAFEAEHQPAANERDPRDDSGSDHQGLAIRLLQHGSPATSRGDPRRSRRQLQSRTAICRKRHVRRVWLWRGRPPWRPLPRPPRVPARQTLAQTQHLRAHFFELRGAALFGFGLDGGDLHLQPRVGFLARAFGLLAQPRLGRLTDESGFRLDGSGRFLFGRLTHLARFVLAALGGFALCLFERAARRIRFLAHARQLGLDPRIRFDAQAFDRGLRVRVRPVQCRLACLLRDGIAQRCRVALRLLVETACLVGLEADALDLLLQLCVGFGLDACDFRLERARGRFLRRLPGFFGGHFAQPLDFLLRLFLGEPCFGGFLAQALELGDQIRIRVGLDASDLALERARG